MRRALPLVVAFGLTLVACASSVPEATARAVAPHPARPMVVRVAAAGDIACASPPYPAAQVDRCQYDDTSDLLTADDIDLVLALGDNQYDRGAYRAYSTYYDAWWGRVKAKTRPVPGNHEYDQDPSARPRGYFRYFGKRVKGPDGLGYYSYDVPAGCAPGQGVCWHFIALSSELCFAPGGCGPAAAGADPGPGNRMYEWLRADLNGHPDERYACTVAYWHHPLFSFSSLSGATAAPRPLWRLLYRARADIVLNGHSHNYQRWKPQTPSGRVAPGRGIREFVVGTGGASKYPLRSDAHPRNLVTAQDGSFGVLELTLRADRYSWRWVTADGQPSFDDAKSGSVSCV